MQVLRTINCCGTEVEVNIGTNEPYVCPNCDKIYTVKNTSHPKYDPEVAQYSYLFRLVGLISIVMVVWFAIFLIYVLFQLFY